MKAAGHDLMVMSLATDMTDDEIKDCIQRMLPVAWDRQQGFCVTISGYDDDKRELWEIPAAVQFMKKMVDFGLISALEVSTTVPSLMSEKSQKLGDKLPGFGALEIWLCGMGRMRKGKNDVGPEEMQEFFGDLLGRARRVAEEICKGPKINTGLKTNIKTTTIADAPIRHGYNKGKR